MFCMKCGKQMPDGILFCMNCGEKMAVLTASPKQPAISPAPLPKAKPVPKQETVPTETGIRRSKLCFAFAVAGIALLLLIILLEILSNLGIGFSARRDHHTVETWMMLLSFGCALTGLAFSARGSMKLSVPVSVLIILMCMIVGRYICYARLSVILILLYIAGVLLFFYLLKKTAKTDCGKTKIGKIGFVCSIVLTAVDFIFVCGNYNMIMDYLF